MLTPTRMITSIFCIVFVGISAFADATLKVRQTVGGQTMENTTYIKGKRERTEQDFGGMKMINIKQCDLKRTIQLNPTTFADSGNPPFSSTKEVLNLSYATLEASLFEAPADYRVAKSMQEMFTGGTMFGGFNMANLPSGNNTSNVDPSDKPTDAGEKTTNLGDLRTSSQAGDKQSGVIRVGLSGIKTGSVGDGMNAQALAGAIQTSLGEYFKGTGVEIVLLEAKLSSAIEQEAKNSNFDFVLFAQVSHKRGGGGFGGLRSIGNVLGGAVPYGGSVAGQVAAETARVTIWTAADAAASIKAKDELTLDVNLKKTDGSAALTRQFKSKAKSEGEDIISPIVEQATQAIVDFVSK